MAGKNYLEDILSGNRYSSTLHTSADHDLGTYHIADTPNLYEIQRSNNFEFIVELGDDMIKPRDIGDAEQATVSADVAKEVIRMSVSQAFIPHFSQETIEVKRGNSIVKYAGTPTFQDGSLTLNDYIGADTLTMLMAWQNQSYDVVTEKVGLVDDYKKTATLIEYSPDLQVVRSWTLYGCWIKGISEGDLNSENNEKHQITVDITYDKATVNDDLI